MEMYLRTLVRQVDSSLADEWERMRHPGDVLREAAIVRGVDLRPPGSAALVDDVTRDARAFTVALRTRVFTFLRAWSTSRMEAALEALDSPAGGGGEAWTPTRLRAALEAYTAEHGRLRLDPEARNLRHTHVEVSDREDRWRVEQMLVDPEMLNDWVAEFDVDLAASREARQPLVRLVRLGSLV
jgi:hypothetical protein